ncbi:MAG: NAD(P)H-hydrate dehydratase [Victivallaceae bacterium]
MKAVSVEQMRSLDQKTIQDFGISSFDLMERAGFGAGQEILDYTSSIDRKHVRRFVILTGKGNNGGDGYVAARYLFEHSLCEIIIYSICAVECLEGAAARHAGKIKGKVKVAVKEKLSTDDFKDGDIIIDALLGTGAKGKLKKPFDNWIKTVNASGLPVIALDIPSGLDGDNGKTCGDCIIADLTVTIGLPKKGLALGSGPVQCGMLKVVEIGIPYEYIKTVESDFEVYTAQDARRLLPRLPVNSYKNTRGAVLVIAGSRDYSGAPFLSALSALRSGSGLVRVAIPQNCQPVDSRSLSLIVNQVKDNGSGYFCEQSIKELEPLIAVSDSIVVGPGIGKHRDLVPFMSYLCAVEKPMVLDADALNVIAQIPEIFKEKESNILTPHPGEMHRLLDAFDLSECLNYERTIQAKTLAEATASTVVLKGNRTITASPDGRIAVNSSGCPALATAGSGDCLTGIIASLIAKETDYFEAVATAVYIHGLTGELSYCGNRAMTADDIPMLIGEAMKKISPFA